MWREFATPLCLYSWHFPNRKAIERPKQNALFNGIPALIARVGERENNRLLELGRNWLASCKLAKLKGRQGLQASVMCMDNSNSTPSSPLSEGANASIPFMESVALRARNRCARVRYPGPWYSTHYDPKEPLEISEPKKSESA